MNNRNRTQLIVAVIIGALALIALAFFLNGRTPAEPGNALSAAQTKATQTAVDWLREQQNPDGGYATFGEDSTVPATLDAILALSAAGDTPQASIDYLQNNAAAMSDFAAVDGGSAGKIILALAASDQNPRDFGGHDFVVSVTDHLSPTGQYAPNPFNQSLAILGLTAVSEPIPANALQWLRDQQADDGSWGDGYGTTQNPDATALSIIALLAGGATADDTAVVNAKTFLANTQLPTGGWEYGAGFGENVNSAALVIQAINALGEDYASDDGAWAPNGIAPLTALLDWQDASGAFQADFGDGRFNDLYATVQAIPAVAGKSY